jgi:hypothetical protein
MDGMTLVNTLSGKNGTRSPVLACRKVFHCGDTIRSLVGGGGTGDGYGERGSREGC